jgi:hypothetical protein
MIASPVDAKDSARDFEHRIEPKLSAEIFTAR